MKKVTYNEPAGFFPAELRKKYKLGEYADDVKKPAKKTAKTTKKK